MKTAELSKILACIECAPEGNERDKAIQGVLKIYSDSITLKNQRSHDSGSNNNKKKGSIQFTQKEIDIMPDYMKRIIVVEGKHVFYRYTHGVYQARYRRDGYSISVGSKNFDRMVDKLIAKFQEVESERQASEDAEKKAMLFKDVAESWLNLKEITVKPSTMRSYKMELTVNILPRFGDQPIENITRNDVQVFLNDFVKAGKNRTAQKVRLYLKEIFELAEEDCGIKSPMTKIVLPHFETKKGTALKKAEEKQLVDFCKEHSNLKAAGAVLLLLYTGMRIGELKTMTYDEKFIYCVSEKTRKGYADVVRGIPISPMLRRVLPYIDFERAKACNESTVRDLIKGLFPERHTHELRYTFITRAKECGINPEVVMEWDGHKFDQDCVTSKVDRGYTDYSEEYYLSEICKFDYDL